MIMSDRKKTVIVTSGPTNEPIDAVMQITNMSTGALGAIIAQSLASDPDIGTVHYLSCKLARKPEGSPKIKLHAIGDTQSLLDALTRLLTDPGEPIDAVVHSAAVGDYKGRYAARAEDLAREAAGRALAALSGSGEGDARQTAEDAILSVLAHPECVQDNGTKISSYEPNLMVMLDLTPKVISHVKKLSPGTRLIGFKLLEGVPEEELVAVASRLREKNGADWIVANDLAKIGNGKHPAIIVGEDGPVLRCRDKAGIARAILGRVTGRYDFDPAHPRDLSTIPDGYDAAGDAR